MANLEDAKRKALKRWLAANVKEYPMPVVINLSGFKADIDDLSGSFNVCLDDQQVDSDFSFEIDGAGAPILYFPMFNSPLGVPASFAAVQLTDDTESAIKLGLAYVLPRLRPFGLDKETGELVDAGTPIASRVLQPEKITLLREMTRSRKIRLQIQVASGQVVILR
jgi:hypothetical protein